ncbi:MAG: hypothetical protein HW380_3560 [Magnetococcales bacterium]|nr:hypothetical protein [Magnetococcales bacterium]
MNVCTRPKKQEEIGLWLNDSAVGCTPRRLVRYARVGVPSVGPSHIVTHIFSPLKNY